MRFRRKKGDEGEVVSGDIVPEQGGGDPSAWTLPADAAVTGTAQDDTLDMAAVQPATAAGGAARSDDHGERTDDDSTTVLEQATADPDATVEHSVVEAPGGDEDRSKSEHGAREEAEEAARVSGQQADRKAEEARLADEEAKRATQAEAEARKAEEEARRAGERAREEADAAEKARAAAEEAAKAQREADEKAREEAARARSARAADESGNTSVTGASITSPGLGGEASPAAAAAANRAERERPAEPVEHAAPSEGPLAPILDNPAVQKKPELLVVGGLAAGFVVAKILKAITDS